MNGVIARGPLRLLVVATVFGLAACGTPTPYQPVADGHGYAEQPLEEDRYRVTFAGNSLTPRETVENYLLYRAAEITLERGYDHFVVVEQETERSTTYHSTLSGFGSHYGFHSFHHHHPHGFGGFASATAWPRDRYAAYANIVMRRGAKPPDDADAYDARAVVNRLAPTIARNPAN